MGEDKNYGPTGFEKAWMKQLNGFNETKIFFKKDGSQTLVQYIDGDKLLGIKMYRSHYEIDNWLGHFQHYLDTGIFDTNAYWIKYNSVKNADGKLVSNNIPGVHAIPMKLEKQVWSVHSPELNEFMKQERLKGGDMGFKHLPRP